MEPMSLIALAGKILSHTSLGDWAKEKLGDAIGHKAAQKIVSTAQFATGVTEPNLLLETLEKDRELAQHLNGQLIQLQHELILAQLQDVQGARIMYQEADHQMADNIADKIMSYNHWLVFLLCILNGLTIYFIEDGAKAGVICSLLSASITALWQERQQVVGFYHGSSLGSKLKGAVGR